MNKKSKLKFLEIPKSYLNVILIWSDPPYGHGQSCVWVYEITEDESTIQNKIAPFSLKNPT